MNELEKRRLIRGLGQRAIDYYADTGECVFCEADDIKGVPHDSECDVGRASGIVVDEARVAEKKRQHDALHDFLRSKGLRVKKRE